MSMEAFITGRSVISSSGAFAAPNPADQRSHENKLANINANNNSSTVEGGEEEDDDDDDGDKNIRMAERTSQLMSSYRSYISGQEDEEMMMSRVYSEGGSGGSTTASVRRSGSLSSSPPRRTSSSMRDRSNNNHNQYTEAPLLRGWNSNSNASRCELEMEEIMYDNDGDDSCNKKHRYTHPIYHSKKFKQFMLAVFVAGAIIGTMMVVSKSSKEGNLPDWDEELKEVLLEEESENVSGSDSELLHHDIGISLPAVEDEKGEEADATEDETEEVSLEPEEENIAEEEEPTKEDDDKKSVTAAPITAAPIEGIGALSGDGIETITRHILCCSSAPSSKTAVAANNANSEEQTSLTNNRAAEEYARAESHHPRWYNRSNGWNGQTYQEALTFCTSQQQQGPENNNSMMMQLCPYEVYCPTGPHHIPLGGFRVDANDDDSVTTSSISSSSSSSRAPISDYPNGWVQVGSQNVCVQYTIMNREGGGSSSSEAKTEVDNSILDEIVVNNKVEGEEEVIEQKEEQGEEVNEEKDDASPKASEANDMEKGGLVEETYVPISVKPGPSSMTEELVVKSNKDQEQASATPEVLTKEATPEVLTQQHQEDPASQSSQTATNTATTTTTSQQPFDMTNILHQKFKPLWLSSREGWNGGSHTDAVQFCNSIRGKQLCPYSAMCPHGPGNAVMGGRHHLEFEVVGEQYAPVMGGENHWVMIGDNKGGGDGEGEMKKKCMTHRQLEGRAPEWGLSGDKAEVKQHIMCCTIN